MCSSGIFLHEYLVFLYQRGGMCSGSQHVHGSGPQHVHAGSLGVPSLKPCAHFAKASYPCRPLRLVYLGHDGCGDGSNGGGDGSNGGGDGNNDPSSAPLATTSRS